MGACKLTLCVLATALCLSYPVNGMDYITGAPLANFLSKAR